MGKQNKAKRLIMTYLNSGPWDPLLSRDLMIRADTGWVPQEVIWGVLAIQNSSAGVGPRGFVLKLYLDCISHKIEHRSIVCISGSAAAEGLGGGSSLSIPPLSTTSSLEFHCCPEEPES